MSSAKARSGRSPQPIRARLGDVIELPNGARVRLGEMADFREDPHNSNEHTPRGQYLVEESMGGDGFARPIAAAADGVLLAGNLAHEIAGRLFSKASPIVVETDGDVPIIHLRRDIAGSQSDRGRRIAVADNRASEVSLRWSQEEMLSLSGRGILEKFFVDGELAAITASSGKSAELAVEEVLMFDHVCPRCGHGWNEPGRARKGERGSGSPDRSTSDSRRRDA